MRRQLEAYFTQILASEPGENEDKAARLAWRLSCFDSGLSYAQYINEQHFTIEGKRVLDVACAWGGHAVAFACQGAQVFAADLNDHMFPLLEKFSMERDLRLWTLRADCKGLPFGDRTIDLVVALELVEHIGSVEVFAMEIARVLRPGGVCLISTPARARSLVEGEPHYGLKGLTILPLSWQRLVAIKLFGRSYPYPITRQYTTASKVIRPFTSRGLTGYPVLRGRLAERLRNSPLALRATQELFWSFVVVTKPKRKQF